MINQVRDFTLPAAYSLLPEAMNSPNASALILSIGLQESQFIARRQGGNGPARGFFQFEKAGIRGVATHASTRDLLQTALRDLCYSGSVGQTAKLHAIIEHNDVLACVFARLLLWTLPGRLPARGEQEEAWRQYLDAWRPGKPRPTTWAAHFTEAWACIDAFNPKENP